MGVHGLWQLLAPVGRRISNDHVRNKVLAVDVSIWLTQLVKAMRDAEGARVRNAHLIGVFRRCIKLLFLSVKPVLVFDGATPAIKRRTVAARRAQREKHEAKLRRLAEKILVNRIKKKAVGDAILKKNNNNDRQRDRIQENDLLTKETTAAANEHRNESSVNDYDEDEIQPAYRDAHPSNASRKKFGVSNINSKEAAKEAEAPEFEAAFDEAGDFIQNNGSDNEEIMLPNDLRDLDDAALVGLPAHMQSKVFKQIKHEQRLRHRESMLQQRDNPTQFSKTQIEGFLRHTALNRRISNVRNVINDNSGVRNRIASDSRREFVFEELKEPNQEEFDLNSDSEDDVLHSSSANKLSGVGPRDILSQIRAARKDGDEPPTFRSVATADKSKSKNKSERQSSSGVGWASRVLSGHGGLELSRMASGTIGYRPTPHTPSEEGDDDIEEDSGFQEPNNISVGGSEQRASVSTPGQGNEDDSDDVEWEDGAVKSDSGNSEGSIILAHSSGQRPGKVRNISEEMSAVGSDAKKSQNLSNTEDDIGNTDESETDRPTLKWSILERDNEKELPAKSMDMNNVGVDLHTSGKPSVAQKGGGDVASLISPKTSCADEGTLKLKQSSTRASGIDTQIVGEDVSEARGLQSYAILRSDTVAKQKCSLDSDMENPQTSEALVDTDSTRPNKSMKWKSDTHRKSRAVEEEENDIQLAIAMSLKESVPNMSNSSDENELPSSRREITTEQSISERRDKDKGPVSESSEAVRNVQGYSDQHYADSPHELSSKHLDANVVGTQGTSGGTEMGGHGQTPGEEMSLMEMERLYTELDTEAQQYKRQRSSHIGAVETVSDEMYAETRDLLKLLGIPYLEAPMEAEAQCAFLNTANIVDGVITEDSDAFLFGAEVVYRQLFADGRFAETYDTQDIKSTLGLDRDHLIRLAHLLGSDYTPGVRGVGIVNAMEIVEAFPGNHGLDEFLEWTKKVTVLDKEPEESVMVGTSAEAVRRRFCWKHRNMKRNWVIREGFPNAAVSEAYLKPTIDNNKDRFKWKEINFDGLAKFCWEKFGWEQNIFDNAVGPLRKELIKRKGLQQTRIPEFFKPHRFAKIRSKRLQQAVKGITGEEMEGIMATLVPRMKRRKTNTMAYNATIDLSPEEEEQILTLLEATEAKTNSGRPQDR